MIQILGYGGLVPALAAAVAMLLSRWLLPSHIRERYAASMAASIGLLVGYGLLPAWAPWQPTTYWHWIPYVGVLAGLVGPLTLAKGIPWGERFLCRALLASLAAWYLVPTWAKLEPVRMWHVAGLAGFMLALMHCLEPLTSRVAPTRLVAALGASVLALALLTALGLSLMFGQVTGIVAAGLLGVAAAMCLVSNSADERVLTIRGLLPWYAILAGGMAYVGYINPTPRLGGLVIVPAAPLALWVLTLSPYRNGPSREGWKGWLLDGAVVLVPVAAAIIWVVVVTS